MNFNNLELECIVSLWLRDRHFSNVNQKEQGFTLIELLVVIIIIGLLAAIALPSFLGQAQKAKFAEAKMFVGTMSRTQQAYYLEKRVFASNLDSLGLGSGLDSSSYTYNILKGSVAGAPMPEQTDSIITNVAVPKFDSLRAFIGITALTNSGNIETAFCKANIIGISQATNARGKMGSGNVGIECPNSNFSRE